MLYVESSTLKPEENLLRWTQEVLSETEKGLIWNLALINQLVQGHSTPKSESIVKIFKRNAKPIDASTVCAQVHRYRYLGALINDVTHLEGWRISTFVTKFCK